MIFFCNICVPTTFNTKVLWYRTCLLYIHAYFTYSLLVFYLETLHYFVNKKSRTKVSWVFQCRDVHSGSVRWQGVILQTKGSNLQVLGMSLVRCYPTDDRIESPGVKSVRWSGIVLQRIVPNLQVLEGSHLKCKHVIMDECLVQGTVWMDDNRFWYLLYQSDDPWRTTVKSATVSQALEK